MARIKGSNRKADTLVGTDDADTITGKGKSDTITGGEGDDIIYGDYATPKWYSRDGDDIIDAGDGDDTVIGGGGSDTILGGAGDDTLYGDYTSASSRDTGDTIDGGAGNDTIIGSGGSDSLLGGSGADIFKFTSADINIQTPNTDTIGDFSLTDGDVLNVNEMLADYGYNGTQDLANYVQLTEVGGNTLVQFDVGGGGDFSTPDHTILLEGNTGLYLDTSSLSNGNLILTKGAPPSGDYIGTEGDDVYSGSENDDLIEGRGGHDTLEGRGGSDTISGGDGNDSIYGDIIDDGVTGISDTLYGDAGDDLVRGGGGNDTIYGGEGNDDLRGNYGNDTIYGEAGNDHIQGGHHDDILHGGDGNDIIYGKDDILHGDGDAGVSGADTLVGGAGNDTMTGYNNADIFKFTAEDIDINNPNTDTITDFDLSDGDTINVGEMLSAYGYNGTQDLNNFVLAQPDGSGNTQLLFDVDGAGNFSTPDHTIFLENVTSATLDNALDAQGNLIFLASPPPGETIIGTTGNDTLVGTAGDDTIHGLSGADQIYGNEGNDIIEGDNPAGGLNTDTDTIYGGAGNDIIHGRFADDTIYGEGGDDHLFGDNRHDTLDGGPGADILEGNLGYDRLTGGEGADIFKFNAEDAGDTRIDTITDFSPTDGDVIDLSDILTGSYNGDFTKYLQIQDNGAGKALLVVDSDGVGDFTTSVDHYILLDNMAPGDINLETLVGDGNDGNIKLA